MAFPTVNTALTPFAFLRETCLQNVCAVLSASMPTLDEMGHALSVPLHAGYPSLITGDVNSYQVPADYNGPYVTIRLRWGRTRYSAGPNIIAENPDGSRMGWLRSDGGKILVEITAVSEPQCEFIADRVIGAIPADYNLDPYGRPQEAVALYALSTFGVNIYGTDEVPEPRADPRDPRPFGMPFRTTIPFVFNAETTWTIPATVQITSVTATTTPITG